MYSEDQSAEWVWSELAGNYDCCDRHCYCCIGEDFSLLGILLAKHRVKSYDNWSDYAYASEQHIQHRNKCYCDYIAKAGPADLHKAKGCSK